MIRNIFAQLKIFLKKKIIRKENHKIPVIVMVQLILQLMQIKFIVELKPSENPRTAQILREE